MTLRIRPLLARFWHGQSGSGSLEFVIAFPIFMLLMLSSIEASFMTLRQVSLERGLDVAVRDIRLSTATPPTHSQIKQRVCDVAGIIPDCVNSVKLEMRPAETRNFGGFVASADCVDRAEEVNPVRQFTPGQDNELMIMRACVVIDPVFPNTGLALEMPLDETGGYKLVSVSAFVQEPR
jgi:Flp pilus assembly protein TadG